MSVFFPQTLAIFPLNELIGIAEMNERSPRKAIVHHQQLVQGQAGGKNNLNQYAVGHVRRKVEVDRSSIDYLIDFRCINYWRPSAPGPS